MTTAKAALLAEYARIAHALAAPARLMLLEQLAQGERGVDSLARKTALSLANCSQHLRQLRRAGLVARRRDGKSVIYRLADPEVLKVMDQLHGLAARNLPETGRLLCALAGGAPEPVSRAELAARLATGRVVLLDVRPPDEFAAAHIPGARNIPCAELEALLPSLPAGSDVVAYCRGPYCIYAYEAVAMLRRHGIAARRLEGGLPEWRAEGREVMSA